VDPKEQARVGAGLSRRERRDAARYRRLIQDALQELTVTASECTLLLDAVRSAHAARDAAVASSGPIFGVADEVISHLVALHNAGVCVTLEIEADLPDGASDNVVRIVTENSRTLKFDDAGFERS
jgi:hypothetical protein